MGLHVETRAAVVLHCAVALEGPHAELLREALSSMGGRRAEEDDAPSVQSANDEEHGG